MYDVILIHARHTLMIYFLHKHANLIIEENIYEKRFMMMRVASPPSEIIKKPQDENNFKHEILQKKHLIKEDKVCRCRLGTLKCRLSSTCITNASRTLTIKFYF